MAVAWVGSAGGYRVTAGDIVVTLPTFAAGDLAVLVAGHDNGTDPAYATPAGWTFRGKTLATNMFSYVWTRVLQAGDSTVTVTVAGSGTAAVGVWRGATLGTVGAFGVRSGTSTTVTAPDIAAGGERAHIFSDRSVAANAGEADTLPTALTYGTSRAVYAGNPTLSASTGICAVYFADSATGSGANTATLKDSSTNAWGLQLSLGSAAAGGRPKVWTGATFVTKPGKVWTGAAWVEKPWKVWTGSEWKTLT